MPPQNQATKDETFVRTRVPIPTPSNSSKPAGPTPLPYGVTLDVAPRTNYDPLQPIIEAGPPTTPTPVPKPTLRPLR